MLLKSTKCQRKKEKQKKASCGLENVNLIFYVNYHMAEMAEAGNIKIDNNTRKHAASAEEHWQKSIIMMKGVIGQILLVHD